MLLRPDAAADSKSAEEVAALRLPFPNDPGRAAGKNFQTPRLSSRTWNGRRGPRRELDGLFLAEEARYRIGNESEMPSGLRTIGQGLLARPQKVGDHSKELLRAADGVPQICPRPEAIWQSKTSCSSAFITARAARWRRRGSTTSAEIISRPRAPGWNLAPSI